MKQVARLFFALWYLLGWMVHVYLAIRAPQVYGGFGKTTLPPLRPLWAKVVMPRIRIFALLVAAFELLVGTLMIGRRWQVRVALTLSMLFNAFLVALGLGVADAQGPQDFLRNRLPNLLFLLGQIPLLFCRWERSLPQALSETLHRERRPH